MNSKVIFRFVLWLVLSCTAIAGVAALDGSDGLPKPDQSGWCCACMCGSKAQDKCSTMCLRMTQPKGPIISEEMMNTCTKLCTRKFASPDREKRLQP